MWLVKLGGSLLRAGYLQAWLETLGAVRGIPITIVTGGGPFADSVRQQQARHALSDETAHDMAVCAMEQFAWLCHGLQPSLPVTHCPDQLQQLHAGGRTAILLPARLLDGVSGCPRDWSLTSDSIAAWLAHRLGARHLVLVKSCQPDSLNLDIRALARRGIVDARFPASVDGYPGRISFCSGGSPAAFHALLEANGNDPVPGMALSQSTGIF
ncbi:MAG: hypothetical protein MI673_05620 [Thiotrichales bacterium]|nr:hypothetical protein [Thiotrichales bacterium]